MEEKYTSGIAFILEGDTEKIFYRVMIEHFVRKHVGAKFEKSTDSNTGEIYYTLSFEQFIVLIKFNVVGTVSQITNSGEWFNNLCFGKHKHLDWTVFLCYDTDSYNNDITKFYDGDWAELRKSIQKHKRCCVIDLAAQADIEDIMLIDSDNVFKYLNMNPTTIPSGSKGKRKMKKIFRLKGRGVAYHEGDRAEKLIYSLDFDKIINLAPVDFKQIEKKCFR